MMDEIEILEVKKESDQQQTLKNLLKMYCYEWSQYNLIDVNDKGEFKFEYHLSRYWTEEQCHAFLVRISGKWAGFVLIDRDFNLHKDYDYAMAEFFIMHKYRRTGAGSYVAKKILDRYPGSWEMGLHPKNITSVKFWDHVIGLYTNGHYELVNSCPELVYADGTLGDVLSFRNDLSES